MYAIIVYLTRVGLALSVLINVLLGGPSNQTFSARNWARKREGKYHVVYFIDAIFVVSAHVINKLLTVFGIYVNVENAKNHCMESWIWWHTHSQKHSCENLIDRMEIRNVEKEGRKVKGIRFRRKAQ